MVKRISSICAFIAVILMSLASCAQSKKQNSDIDMAQNDKKVIVCYFSATGTTEAAARRIADIVGADLHEIVPEKKYMAADLDWTDSLSRSSVEMRNRLSRPALKDSVTDLSGYSVVYIGYPNWWNTHPTIINTFIEANDLKGKTIVPFMTSGGSNITNSEKELKDQYPGLSFGEGMLMNGKTNDEIKDWIKQYNNL
ncbi:MAG: flavodoxin [Muribaculum sp.]|nr:flavodoxin [Muribaculum sp.]